MTPPRVLLVEIGTPAELPPVTPPAPRPPSSWTPNPRPSPGLAPSTGLAVEVMADAAKLTWTRSTQPGALTVVEGAPDVDGTPGAWIEITRTADQTYTIALPSGAFWVRLYATLNGRDSIRTNAVVANPVEVGQAITDLQQQAQEMLDDFADMDQRVDGVQAEAQQAAAALNLRADQLRADIDATMAQLNDILGAEEWDAGTAYLEGDLVQFDGKLYRAVQDAPAGTPVSNAAYWELIGDYASLGDAVAAALSQLSSHADELLAHAESLNLLGAKNGAGTAWLLNMDTVRVSASETMAQWRASLQASFDDANARIDAEETARADGDAALASTLATVQATANNAATKAELTIAQNALAAADQALAERADLTEARLGSIEGSVNASFERDGGWGVLASDTEFFGYSGSRSGTRVLAFRPSTVADRNQINEARVDVAEGQTVRAGVWARWGGNAKPQASSTVSALVRGYDKDGGYISGSTQTLASLSGDQLSANYQIIEGALSVPAGWFYAALQLRVQNYSGPANGLIALDDAFLQVDARGVRAVATALAQTQAEVTDHEGRITANTTQTNLNTAAIEGKADSTTVQQISNTVDQHGDAITAHGTQLSGLEATVGTHTASINEQREVLAAASVTGLVLNASFEEGPAEQGQADGWGSLPANSYVFAYGNARTGGRVLRFDASSTTDRSAINNGRTPVTTGQQVRAGYWARYGGSGPLNSGSTVSLIVRGFDVGGDYVGGSAITVASVPGNSLTSNYQRISGAYTVPANVRTVTVQVRVQDQSAGSLMVDDVFLEPVSESLADVFAKYSLAVQAGGDIAGIQLLAGGGISAFRILASMFSIVDPGGTGGYTHSAGVSVWRIGSAMIAIGPGFGAGNEFVFWAGPNQSNLNNCTRANAGMYFTRTNDAYFGGTLTAGALYHPSQATFTAYPLNVQAEVGPFVSQGGTKRVSSQFRYLNNGTVPGNVTTGHGQTFNGTVTIYRRIGTGAWTQVNSYPVTGVKSAIYQSELNRTVVVTTINGAISYNDTSTSTQDFSYRARVTALSDPTVAGVPVDGEITIASKEG